MGLLDGLLGSVLGGMASGRGGGLPDLGGMLGGRRGGLPSGLPGMGGNFKGAAMAAMLMMGLQLLQRNGGIEGVLGKLRQKGYGRQANSWVSTGDNEAIDENDLADVLGREDINDVSRQFGVDPQEARGGLAALFPEIINQMTPSGRVETGSDDVVEQALTRLRQNQQPAS
ncbi:MAG TPA: YidB family protein [Casimicrobiaceae bacterium]|nr:YidB family protein [Casimicrobiaceae bacterium]